VKLLGEVVALQGDVRADLDRMRREVVRVHVAVDGLPFLPHAAVVVDAEVPADADEPGLEVRAPVEGGQRSEHFQEDVLRQVFRLVVPADELVRDVEHPPPVLADDLLPRLLVALQATLDQGVGFGQRWGRVGRRHESAVTPQNTVRMGGCQTCGASDKMPGL
jgi:hypothetical protein